MTDFTLEPDELDPDRPVRRSGRLVASGLAPTAEVPPPRGRTTEPVPAYGPCPTCGRPVLAGLTRAGMMHGTYD